MSAQKFLWFLSPLGSYRVLAFPAPVNAAGPAMALVRKFGNLWDLLRSFGSTPCAITKVTFVRGIKRSKCQAPLYMSPGLSNLFRGFHAGGHGIRLVFVTDRGEKRIFQATLSGHVPVVFMVYKKFQEIL
jgi:hypothetical protein